MTTYYSLLFDRKLKEAESFRKGTIPAKLVKFVSLAAVTDKTSNDMKFRTLAEQKLWFSTTKLLNDPYEFQCMYVHREKLAGCGYTDEVISLFESTMRSHSANFALVSLSSNSFDCLPMWAYYTNNYRGFCVEYDVVNPYAIFEVEYEPERLPVASIMANYYLEFQKMIENKQIINDEIGFYSLMLRHQFFLKHTSWKHENEYRIIYPISEANCPDGYGINVELASVGMKTSRIVAGLHCSDEHKERLARISKQLDCGDISVSKISGNKYTLLEDM